MLLKTANWSWDFLDQFFNMWYFVYDNIQIFDRFWSVNDLQITLLLGWCLLFFFSFWRRDLCFYAAVFLINNWAQGTTTACIPGTFCIVKCSYAHPARSSAVWDSRCLLPTKNFSHSFLCQYYCWFSSCISKLSIGILIPLFLHLLSFPYSHDPVVDVFIYCHRCNYVACVYVLF